MWKWDSKRGQDWAHEDILERLMVVWVNIKKSPKAGFVIEAENWALRPGFGS